MMSCEQARGSIHPYVDGEIGGQEQLAIEEHLLDCGPCRAEYDSTRQVVETVRGSKPLFQASPSLPVKLREILEGDRSRRKRIYSRAAIAAVSVAAAIVLVAFLPTLRSQRFTSFAADTHLLYKHGSLPLGVVSEQPGVVSGWLQTQLPFHLALPNYPAELGEPKSYSLVGARRMQYDGRDVAYLAYTMNTGPISLLVASGANVIPSRGQTYTSGKLVFHFSAEQGLKLITWTDRGLSYALVSDLQVSGAQSCIVCHGSKAERQRFENLFPE
jgi:anti-sigma factor RsiW